MRSKIEMAKYLAGSFDLTMFDYKSGVFLDDRAIRGMKVITVMLFYEIIIFTCFT